MEVNKSKLQVLKISELISLMDLADLHIGVFAENEMAQAWLKLKEGCETELSTRVNDLFQGDHRKSSTTNPNFLWI